MDDRTTPRKPWPSEGIAEHVSFSGHETFVFRYSWLKKAVDAVLENAEAFNSESAMVILGVGKNMVRSIRHWGLATRVLEEETGTRGRQLKVTQFGELIFGKGGSDPHLEDTNSLWLLHWQLSTNQQRSTTWCWAFNLLPSSEFTRDTLIATIQAEIPRHRTKQPSANSVRRDVDCFIRTYVAAKNDRATVLEDSLDCPLVELNLIAEDPTPGLFRFKRGIQSTLADEVFIYALLEFWDRNATNRETLSFADVAYGSGSPGRVFKLDENGLAERLGRLEQVSGGRLVYSETAGLNQIYRRSKTQVNEILRRHYHEFDPGNLIGV
ncbi:MAG: DUF4007 family protein [Terriglobia bacterium]|jgi:hypothetical protein